LIFDQAGTREGQILTINRRGWFGYSQKSLRQTTSAHHSVGVQLRADLFLATIHMTPDANAARTKLEGSGTITGANARYDGLFRPELNVLDDPPVVICRTVSEPELFAAKRLPDEPNAMPTGKPNPVANDVNVALVSTLSILPAVAFAT
jgi:hypothetical protein